jgi:uncharacterized protein with HEPN domain
MREYLLHDILQAAEAIRDFTQGMSCEMFVDDDRTLSAVLYKFAVMGEATKLLPEKTYYHHPPQEL